MTSVTFLPAVGGDGTTVTDDSNATTGLGNGGHRTRFVPSLYNLVNIANYVNSTAATVGTAMGAPCRVASVTNITLSGVQTIDGVTLVALDRVLVTGQTTASQNGVYIVNSGVWTRSTDANTSTNLIAGKAFAVSDGTTNGATIWVVATTGLITINSTSIVFERLPSKSKANIFTGTTSTQALSTTTISATGLARVDIGNVTGASLTGTGGASNFIIGHTANNGDVTVSNTGGGIAFSPSGVERLRILSTGQTAFGATTNQFGGQVEVTAANGTNASLALYAPSTTGQPKLQFLNSNSNCYISTMTNGAGLTFGNSSERMRLVDNGNLLIGTTSDNGSQLQVSGAATVGANLAVGTTPSAWGSTVHAIEAGAYGAFYDSNGGQSGIVSNAYLNGAGNWITKSAGNSSLRFENNIANATQTWSFAPAVVAGGTFTYTSRMVLAGTSGNLLIGTTSDVGARAHITSSGTNAALALDGNATNQSSPELLINRSGASESASVGQGASVQLQNSSNNSAALIQQFSNNLQFFNFAGSSWTERMRVAASGNLLVGTTTDNAARLQTFVAGNSKVATFENTNVGSAVVGVTTLLPTGSGGYHFQGLVAGATTYQVLANGNVQNTNNSYGAISDIKLKENITPAPSILAKLNQVNIVNYTLKADVSKTKLLGVIAQELEQVFPSLIETTKDFIKVVKTREVDVPAKEATGTEEAILAHTVTEEYVEEEENGEVTKGVKYSVFVPMLIKAVQELTAINSALADRVAKLEAKLK